MRINNLFSHWSSTDKWIFMKYLSRSLLLQEGSRLIKTYLPGKVWAAQEDKAPSFLWTMMRCFSPSLFSTWSWKKRQLCTYLTGWINIVEQIFMTGFVLHFTSGRVLSYRDFHVWQIVLWCIHHIQSGKKVQDKLYLLKSHKSELKKTTLGYKYQALSTEFFHPL